MTPKRILVIDDETVMLDCIKENLDYISELEVVVSSDPRQALELLESSDFKTIITDINMPQLSGLQLLKQVADKDDKIPVILITCFGDLNKMRTAIQLGAFDFLRKPFDMSELLVAVKQALEKNELLIQNELYQQNLELLVHKRTLELSEAKNKLEKHYLNTMHAMVNAIEANDIYTRGHSERVTAISLLIGRELGLGTEEKKQLRIGTILHDLGKIGIYKPIWDKADKLSEHEYQEMKQHPLIGARIIDPIGLPKAVHDVILQHHERIDGTGYPLGIPDAEISLLAKIAAVADAFDAMTSQRSYRQQADFLTASQEIHRNLDTQFDAYVGKVFCERIDEVVTLLSDPEALKSELYREL